MKLPEITEVERFRYSPGDRFVLHYDGYMVNREQAEEIVSQFRVIMGLPDTAPVCVIDASWDLKIVEESPDGR